MIKVIGVKFPNSLKIYDFLDPSEKLQPRDSVVVETTQGQEIGQVVYVGKKLNEKDTEEPVKEIVRKAKKEDIEKSAELENSAKELFPLFAEKIAKYELAMQPVGTGYSLDETKAIFYFTADGRVDFRELAKELSRTVQKQAILRQIGPRDEAKLIGGFGRCGREVCCASFLLGADGVTMDTVEKQYGMVKSASKVSGICGRLMCCLNYEEPEKHKKRVEKEEK